MGAAAAMGAAACAATPELVRGTSLLSPSAPAAPSFARAASASAMGIVSGRPEASLRCWHGAATVPALGALGGGVGLEAQPHCALGRSDVALHRQLLGSLA